MELDYTNLTPKQAWTLFKEDGNSQLVDCGLLQNGH